MLGPQRSIETGFEHTADAVEGKRQARAEAVALAAVEAEGIRICRAPGDETGGGDDCAAFAFIDDADPRYPGDSTQAALVAEIMAEAVTIMTGVEVVPRPLHSRLLRGVTAHFVLRSKDWIMTSVLFWMGVVLLTRPDVFAQASAFDLLAQYGPAESWGLACIAIGLFRFVSLVLNGTFPWFLWSPHFRTLGALLSGFVWFQVSLALALSASQTPVMAVIVPHLLIFDLLNAYLAASEAGIAERRRRNGSSEA